MIPVAREKEKIVHTSTVISSEYRASLIMYELLHLIAFTLHKELYMAELLREMALL